MWLLKKREEEYLKGLTRNSPVNKQSSSEFLSNFHLTACVLLLLQGFSMTLLSPCLRPLSGLLFIFLINGRR